jgi:hypothetical protein
MGRTVIGAYRFLSREMKIAGNKEFSMGASSACAGTPTAPADGLGLHT